MIVSRRPEEDCEGEPMLKRWAIRAVATYLAVGLLAAGWNASTGYFWHRENSGVVGFVVGMVAESAIYVGGWPLILYDEVFVPPISIKGVGVFVRGEEGAP
jgi:hypothetical protein